VRRERAPALSEAEIAQLDTLGFLVLPGALEPDEIVALRAIAAERVDDAPRRDPPWKRGGTLHLDLSDSRAAQIVDGCSRLNAAISHLLCDRWQRTMLSLRAPQPGYGAQALHGAATMSPAHRAALDGDPPHS
jgi:hypothetical protein